MVETENENVGAAPSAVLTNIVEPRRKRGHISIRHAADKANMSEATWRQLVNQGVTANGKFFRRRPRRDQVLDMAHAVGVLNDAARALRATEDEVADTKARVINRDPASEEILGMRHLGATEKLRLLATLEELRKSD